MTMVGILALVCPESPEQCVRTRDVWVSVQHTSIETVENLPVTSCFCMCTHTHNPGTPTTFHTREVNQRGLRKILYAKKTFRSSTTHGVRVKID